MHIRNGDLKVTHKIHDIHSHILYGVDDGAKNLNMSIEMLRSAYEQGARSVVCTSHSGSDIEQYFKNLNTLRTQFKKENVNIDLYSGCEIYCDSENINTVITELNNKLIPTINNTQYILVEFFPYARADEIVDCVKQLCKHNYKIIIAHVERCLDLFKEEKWIPMLQQLGCYFQINAYSIFDERDLRIKTFAQKLLKEKSVTFLGSDAHRTTHRPYMIQNGLNYVYENCDEEYAKDICYRNAESLLNIK